jgi:indolepyruvate ferredoxin oxidoreductase beta subunit
MVREELLGRKPIGIRSLGNIQAANVVLIGAFSNFFPEIREEQWTDSIKTLLAAKLHELNIKAFYEGRRAK